MCFGTCTSGVGDSDSSVPLLNSLESVILDLDGRKRFHDFLERAFALENLFFYESVLEFRGVEGLVSFFTFFFSCSPFFPLSCDIPSQ